MAEWSAEREEVSDDQEDTGLSSAKPVFFMQSRGLASHTAPTAQDVYKGIGSVIESEDIRGIQRVGNLWRIYPATTEERIDLLTQGITVNGARVTLMDANPFTPRYDGIKVTIHGVPLSASDTVISAALRSYGCILMSGVERQLLRIDGKLTNCQTGGRTVFLTLAAGKHLPRYMEMGRYKGAVYYRYQPTTGRFQAEVTCKKCLLQGHYANACPNDWVCTQCRRPGHKRGECPLQDKEDGDDESSSAATTEDELEQTEPTEPAEPAADGPTEQQDPDEKLETDNVNQQQRADKQPDPGEKLETDNVSQRQGATGNKKRADRKKKIAVSKKGTVNREPAAMGRKITDFITSVRETTVSDSETTPSTRSAANIPRYKPTRSPKTPPEEQQARVKRPKGGGGPDGQNENNSEDSAH